MRIILESMPSSLFSSKQAEALSSSLSRKLVDLTITDPPPPSLEVSFVSTSSAEEEDSDNDNDSLSTISSILGAAANAAGDENVTDSSLSPPRSIFKDYWKKNGEEGRSRPPHLWRISSSSSSSTGSSIYSTCNISENSSVPFSLVREEAIEDYTTYNALTDKFLKDAGRTLALMKRRMLGGALHYCKAHSSPSLVLSGLEILPEQAPLRKANSTSVLLHRTHRNTSCLRPGKYSDSTSCAAVETSSTGSGSTVRFSQKVDVRVFKPPFEIWADKDWSDLFR